MIIVKKGESMNMIRTNYWGETDGTREGYTVYCPSDAYGDCPYCDQEGVCHIKDPMEECSDFGEFYEDWDEYYRNYEWGEVEGDIDDDVDEMGFNPYEGAYDYDC
jgi:hypothetical protein